jgi:hypothetical protein
MGKKNPPANNAPAPGESPQEALLGSNIHPATLLIADHEYQLGDFVREAFTVSGLSVAEWNALPETERDQLIDHAVVELGGPSFLPEEQTPLEPVDLVECAVLYDSVYGKHDDIIQLPRAQADAAHAAGFVDTHPHAMKAIRAAKEAKASA